LGRCNGSRLLDENWKPSKDGIIRVITHGSLDKWRRTVYVKQNVGSVIVYEGKGNYY
jgi:hypothetical protein